MFGSRKAWNVIYVAQSNLWDVKRIGNILWLYYSLTVLFFHSTILWLYSFTNHAPIAKTGCDLAFLVRNQDLGAAPSRKSETYSTQKQI